VAGASVRPQARRVDFRFTGDAGEYFRIWIINLLLSVLTLGIYSAWAKVRNKQYFYRNTILDGFSLDYVADPIRILKGRLIIAAAGGVLVGAQYYSRVAYAIVFGLFLLSTPWVLVKALSFGARNTTYRNIRFAFQGTAGESYGVYLTCALVQLLTLGTATPYVNFRQHKFMVERHNYGAERFLWNRKAGDYFRVYLRALLLTLPIIASFIGIGALLVNLTGKSPLRIASLLALPGYACLLIPAAYLRANIANLLFDGLRVGPHALRCRQQLWPLLRLYVENLIAIVGTLGLAFPWARIRMARYKASCMKAIIVGEFNVLAFPSGNEPAAYGEAAHDLGDFDFDLG
jgi:uncharacterized membrane protein YjgN (DUF898 family)